MIDYSDRHPNEVRDIYEKEIERLRKAGDALHDALLWDIDFITIAREQAAIRAREAWNEAKASTFEHGATKG